MNWINKTNLNALLPELLKNKVYVGLSAGSMVACKDLALNISQKIYEEDLDQEINIPGLNYVNFYFLPHLNSP
jgi:dipeptidase E